MTLPLVSPPEPEVDFVRPPAWSGSRGDPVQNSRFPFTPEDVGPGLPLPDPTIQGVTGPEMSKVWTLDLHNHNPFTSTQDATPFDFDDARVEIVRAYARF